MGILARLCEMPDSAALLRNQSRGFWSSYPFPRYQRRSGMLQPNARGLEGLLRE